MKGKKRRQEIEGDGVLKGKAKSKKKPTEKEWLG